MLMLSVRKLAFTAPRKKEEASRGAKPERARAASIDRRRSKRTSAMLMLPAGKLAFEGEQKKKQALKRAKKES